MTPTASEKLSKLLATFFKDEPHKAVLWILTANPMFGGISPAQLIVLRGEKGFEKVLKFAEAQL